MLSQRRKRLTCIEAAMGCDAGPTLNWYWVGTLCCMDVAQQTQNIVSPLTTSAQRLRRWSTIVQMLYKCFVFIKLASTGDGGGNNRLTR